MIFYDYAVAVGVGVSYLAAHVVLYLVVIRSRPFFQSERGIFLYHFVSASVFTVVAVLATFAHFNDAAFAIAIGLIATHCIYSISFLELWTLAEGSYSMSILTAISSQRTVSRNSLIDAFARIGDAKKNNRLCVLSKLSLAHREGDHWQLSARGRVVAGVLNVLVWLAAIKNRG